VENSHENNYSIKIGGLCLSSFVFGFGLFVFFGAVIAIEHRTRFLDTDKMIYLIRIECGLSFRVIVKFGRLSVVTNL
jgi:hypothetical protein